MKIASLDKNIRDRDDLLEALPSTPPVYMVKYKGKVYGYHPSDIEDIESCIAINYFKHTDNWAGIAAAMFRPVNFPTKFAHSWGWKTVKFGKDKIKIKEITDFTKNYITYKCKNVEYNEIDVKHFEDFPVEIVIANLGFTLGVGMTLGASSMASSTPQMSKVTKRMSKTFQELLLCSRLFISLEKPKSLISTVEKEYMTLLQDKYSNTYISERLLVMKKKLLWSIDKDLWVLTGKDTHELTALHTLYESIVSKDTKLRDIKSFLGIGNVITNLLHLTITRFTHGKL